MNEPMDVGAGMAILSGRKPPSKAATKRAETAALMALLDRAHAAGHAAATACVPNPMIVRSNSILVNGVPALDRDYFVSEGACGFAWVTVHPANSPLAKAMKAKFNTDPRMTDYPCHRGYHGGLEYWIGDYNQSIARKEAYARAFAAVLTDAGHKAYAGSRLD